MNRARIITVTVQPQIVMDDGEHLTPQAVKPLTILWRDWPDFAAHGLQDALRQLQEQIDGSGALIDADRLPGR